MATEGLDAEARMGRERQLITSRLHGENFELARLGLVFSQTTTPLGLAIPIYTATAPVGNVVWNPMGSGVNVVPISYTANWVSGTSTAGTVGLMAVQTRQSTTATAAWITAFAATTPVSTFFSAGTTSKVFSSNAGTITCTAGAATNFVQAMFCINAEGAAAALHTTQPSTFEFNGKWIFPPGSLIYVAATLATTALYAQTIVWAELPA
jgi:hypothetical protein